MKTFETYVQEQCPGEYATNNSPEGFERWLEQLDVQEVMDMAEAYGKDVEQEVVQRVRGEIESLEVSCIDDRLLGRSDEYLVGYNTSTERWRKERDDILESLDRPIP